MTRQSRLFGAKRMVTRRRQDAIGLLVAIVAFFLASLPIDAHDVSGLEADAFHLVNDLPGSLYWGVWVVMQLGNFFAVPVAALAALAARRFRLAAALVVSGGVVWLLAKVIKDLIERGRPAELINDVVLHHAPAAGNGYVSGHAAVAVALATVAAPYLGRRLRIAVWILAALVCVARVYVGAHLPLDSVGGAAFGFAVGSLVNLVLGVPAPNTTARA